MSTGNPTFPVSSNVENRVNTLSKEVKGIVSRIKEEGLSERAQVGYLATIEYFNELIDSTSLEGKDMENFILEVQGAIRTLVHGMTMGSQDERREEQLNIANGKGTLKNAISEALKKANKTGRRGPDETVMKSEHLI